jgi:hypothetical protein
MFEQKLGAYGKECKAHGKWFAVGKHTANWFGKVRRLNRPIYP